MDDETIGQRPCWVSYLEQADLSGRQTTLSLVGHFLPAWVTTVLIFISSQWLLEPFGVGLGGLLLGLGLVAIDLPARVQESLRERTESVLRDNFPDFDVRDSVLKRLIASRPVSQAARTEATIYQARFLNLAVGFSLLSVLMILTGRTWIDVPYLGPLASAILAIFFYVGHRTKWSQEFRLVTC